MIFKFYYIFTIICLLFFQVEDEMIQCIACEDWFHGLVCYFKMFSQRFRHGKNVWMNCTILE